MLAGDARPAWAVESDLKLQAGAVAGYDNNPLRVGSNGSGGAFSELRLDMAWKLSPGKRADFFLDLGARQRSHAGDLSNADFTTADLRAGIGWTPLRGETRQFSLALGGLYSLQRLTFVDRATGQVYTVVEDPAPIPPVTRSIPDRLDLDRSGTFLDLRWKLNRRVHLFLDTALHRNDYVEDYAGSNVLESLDHDLLTISPGISVIVHPRARLTASVVRSVADYAGRTALDLGGNPVPGVFAEYRYTTLRLSLDLLPGQRWETSFGAKAIGRDDLYASYYDFGGTSLYAWVKGTITPRATWQLFASYQELDYDNAVVSTTPATEFRSSDSLRLVGRLEHTLTSSLRFFVEGGHQDSDSNDPDYTYRRAWGMTGILYRH